MADKIEKVKKKRYMCQNGHVFGEDRIRLVPFSNEPPADLGKALWSDGSRFYREGKPASGFFPACPVCKLLHLAGFNIAT